MAGGPIAAAPPAGAGCRNLLWAEHPFAQECDGPIRPDGTWQRCMTYSNYNFISPEQLRPDERRSIALDPNIEHAADAHRRRPVELEDAAAWRV